MHGALLIPALLGATAFAGNHGAMLAQEDGASATTTAAYGAPTSCDAQGADILNGMGKQLVTVVHVSNEDGSQLRYFPENIEAPVGSIVQFQFHPRNHTITESSFDEPCKPLADNLKTPERPGQRSGFVPVTVADTELKVYNMLVNDTRPIWLFCGQTPHCQRGMAMVINEPKDNPDRTLAKYKEAAALVPLPEGFTPPAPAPSSTAAPAGDAASSAAPSDAAATAASTTPGQAQAASGTGTGVPATFTGPDNGALAPGAGALKNAGFAAVAVAAFAALL